MSLADFNQRDLATDPTHSYIVQAPAGSGKTEVLTQRYLRLLGAVQNPEEIVCITFTKKAANEMRERILSSLKDANSNIRPSSKHKEKTYEYATNAISRSTQFGWNILEQPNSLKIITIDSLCQSLANAIFIQESQTAFAEICTNTKSIYLQAARDCINYAAEDPMYKQDLINILSHVDNRQDTLLYLLAELLNSRDTWLDPLLIAKHQDKETFEKAIQLIERNAITNFIKCLDDYLQQELLKITKKLFLIIGNHDANLLQIDSLKELNTETTDELCGVLLTSNNALRKAFDHHVGLKKGVCSDTEYQTLKTQSKELFETLNEIPNFIENLCQIKNLPYPHYTDQQWTILQSLFKLLPLLVAHLNVYFNQSNQVDFIGIASEALNALGEELSPTNLALYLDNKIQHILVDEFQDTSLTQFHLLKKLVNGWENNDGRTLFIVGDPQQSIYRFRGAEVGLFLKARLTGIGNVKLIPLNLSCNFRSDGKIVNWVNDNFKNIFPSSDDVSSGAIKYSTSIPINPEKLSSFIQAYEFEDANHEAFFVAQTIKSELQENPDASIAILVRSRRQLAHIITKIKEQNLNYQGVDIDLLVKQWHIKDVHSLVQALLMPGNRLAWLSLLRSPFCGLCLEDILEIARYSPSKSILYSLTNLKKLKNISEDGILRAEYIFTVITEALNCRAQTNTIDWLKNTLLNLQVDNILNIDKQTDIEQYWQLLEESLDCGEMRDWDLFNEQLNALYAKQSQPTSLQIMTIHKSKGLEFDCVIIPGLGTKSVNQDNSLFRSLNLPDENDEDIFFFSPIKAAYDEQCKLYNYLKKIDEQKANYELQRLLYVAVTRAKSKLYLTDYNTSVLKNSFRSFLGNIEFKKLVSQEIKTTEPNSVEVIYRLPSNYYTPMYKPKYFNQSSVKYQITSETQRIIGVVTHEILQWICNNHIQNYEDIPWNLAENRLLSSGIINQEHANSITVVKQQILNLYHDKIGRWIISEHTNEKNEYELLVKKDNNFVIKIIDRTFNADGYLWIIDFKTGAYNPTSEKEYVKQVNEYAKALSHLTTKIKCGLYYLENNYWYNWKYVTEITESFV